MELVGTLGCLDEVQGAGGVDRETRKRVYVLIRDNMVQFGTDDRERKPSKTEGDTLIGSTILS